MVSFIGGRSLSSRRNPLTWHKSLTNLSHIFVFSMPGPLAGFELTTLVVIDTVCIGSYKPNYHTTTTAPSTNVLELFIEMSVRDTRLCCFRIIYWNVCQRYRALLDLNVRYIRKGGTIKELPGYFNEIAIHVTSMFHFFFLINLFLFSFHRSGSSSAGKNNRKNDDIDKCPWNTEIS